MLWGWLQGGWISTDINRTEVCGWFAWQVDFRLLLFLCRSCLWECTPPLYIHCPLLFKEKRWVNWESSFAIYMSSTQSLSFLFLYIFSLFHHDLLFLPVIQNHLDSLWSFIHSSKQGGRRWKRRDSVHREPPWRFIRRSTRQMAD